MNLPLADTWYDLPLNVAYKSYLVIAYGGDVTLQRLSPKGDWVEVSGSPILDGEEIILTTHSRDKKLRAKSTVADTDITLGILD